MPNHAKPSRSRSISFSIYLSTSTEHQCVCMYTYTLYKETFWLNLCRLLCSTQSNALGIVKKFMQFTSNSTATLINIEKIAHNALLIVMAFFLVFLVLFPSTMNFGHIFGSTLSIYFRFFLIQDQRFNILLSNVCISQTSCVL